MLWTKRANKLLTIFFLAICLSCAAPSSAENSRAAFENEKALVQARENIEKFRKGDVRIKVEDAGGKTLEENLKIRQIAHDFKFGGYLKIDDLAPEKLPAYERNFKRLFNFAVVGTYWDFVENEKGAENWSWFERETALARKMNLPIQAAPVLWGTNDAGTPKWLPKKKDALGEILDARVKNVLGKYANGVEEWEVVNEALAPKQDFFAANSAADYVEKAFRTARAANPEARLLINEYGVFGDEADHNYNRDKYFEFLKKMNEKNVPFDVVGIQAHANGEWFAPANVAALLDRYAALGKPLQITEFSAQTLEYDDRRTPLNIAGNYRSGVWNAEKQAEFYREFYTVAFGNPHVEAITAWGLDDERAWLPGIGLIDEKGAAKANYRILDRLINDEWQTRLETNAPNGTVDFRGFYGDYEVEATIGKKIVGEIFRLKKNERNEWILRVK